MTKKLKAPKGTDEANANGQSFRVENDGTVTVPDDAVAPLLEKGGFTEMPELMAAPEGMVLVKHGNDPNASCGGEKIGEAFLVTPATANELVASHGFEIIEHVHLQPELKQDGPTIVDWVTAGYKASNYPPGGYASKSTAEEIAAAVAAETAAEKKE